NGTNDVAVIGGVSTGAVTEDVAVTGGNLTTSGLLSITDADAGQSSFMVQAGTAGSNGYGTFTLDAAGNWTYTAADSQTAIQQLGAGQDRTSTRLTSSPACSSCHIFSVTINGTNDTAVIGGVATARFTEDVGVLARIFSNRAAPPRPAPSYPTRRSSDLAGTAGSNGYGTFTLDAAGNWTYTAADSQTAIQQLGAG